MSQRPPSSQNVHLLDIVNAITGKHQNLKLKKNLTNMDYTDQLQLLKQKVAPDTASIDSLRHKIDSIKKNQLQNPIQIKTRESSYDSDSSEKQYEGLTAM